MFQRLSYPVHENGKTLAFPFAGGLNAPQLSAADLNNDHIPDLVIFDRAGDVLLTFLNEGTPNQTSYRFAPEYACNFPALKNYVLLRDYDHDGAADIFCSGLDPGSQEMQVFHGYFDHNQLKFKPFTFTYPGCSTCDNRLIYYPSSLPGFWNNLFIANTDYPDVNDIDGDGDLDILTFDGSVGGNVWLIQNMSVEMGHGRFAPSKEVIDRGERHPGSTLMTYDQDGDGDMEIVLGDISFACFNMMTNGGSKDVAWMTAQDTAFPGYDTPVDLTIFPTPFYLDLNNDGKKDLVAAPNSKFTNDDRQCVWYYPNAAGNGISFHLATKSLLVNDMIDIGTAAHPALVDVDADGLLDLVVGNYGYYGGGLGQNASLYYFRNTGTDKAPQFTLEDTDWAGLSEFAPNDYDFCPAFGDLDDDGDLDLLVGSNLGALYYYRNTAGAGKPLQFERDLNVMWVSMDIGNYSTPAIVDLDLDGRKDIVMGERNGNVNFFKNIGASDNPLFNTSPTFSKLGAVDARVPPSDVGFSIPVFIDQPSGERLLIIGTQEGHLEAYNNISATESPYGLESDRWGNLDEGNRSSPAFGDLDGDGILEMVVGNLRGGLALYKTVLVDCNATATKVGQAPVRQPQLSPNPARNWVRVEWPAGEAVQWQVFDLLGRRAAAGEAPGGTFTIPVSAWTPGLYFLEMRCGSGLWGRTTVVVAR